MARRLCPAIVAALLLVIAAMAWRFIVAGSIAPAEDGRTAILLDPGERALVLREMRGFVAGVERISDALARQDMKAVADAARGMGMERAHDAPASLMGKLPLEFKRLALGTHRAFDAIAAEAEAGGEPGPALAQLAGVLQKCVECHDSYQIAAPTVR